MKTHFLTTIWSPLDVISRTLKRLNDLVKIIGHQFDALLKYSRQNFDVLNTVHQKITCSEGTHYDFNMHC